MTAHRKRVECNATLPYIPYDKARTSWFIHDNTAYSLELAPTSIFKAGIRLLMTKDELSKRNIFYEDSRHNTLAPLYYENNIDILQRWYLLCTIKRKMKLFSSREEAERAIRDVVS
jgi:hypothetical protein